MSIAQTPIEIEHGLLTGISLATRLEHSGESERMVSAREFRKLTVAAPAPEYLGGVLGRAAIARNAN